MSSNLFNAVLQEAFNELDWEDKGIKIDGKRLSNLRFADDIFLIGESREEVENLIQELIVACKKVGLEINVNKTKYMSNASRGDVYANSQKLEKVYE